MRSLSHLCFLIFLFCCGLSVNAAITGCHRARTAPFVTRPFLKILSCDGQVRHHGRPSPVETIITTYQQPGVSSFKTDLPDGADTGREHFLAGINTFSSKVQATRLLPYLHAIIRSLIYPQHIFW
ncbi:hypothetical protein [Chitinophaga sp. S165]|uniref:hypothetical protein n=1 Tax=Chitinophaga sp. S165 TaxID=2135462 RepID=UPI000D83C856|nr:hypothetical protein [Chitinophaga sp. S165]PWV46965.1 hypothetical protein C7475_10952 [Chitinophaga sp. S165]